MEKSPDLPQTVVPAPRSSSRTAMGSAHSKPSTSTPQKTSITALANTGVKLKRAFAARRKKSEDATTLFAAHNDRHRLVAEPPPMAAVTPSKVITGGPKSSPSPPQPSSLPPPPPPPQTKPTSLQPPKLSVSNLPPLPSDAPRDHGPDNRTSIIPISPGISSAVNYIRMDAERREREDGTNGITKANGGEAVGKEKEKEERSKAQSINEKDTADKENEEKLKQVRRKSDSTMSHHTIRPGAMTANRTSRPVSMAESLHSNHTIVPVNKRLSALLTDAEFQMPEEDDSSFKSASEELVSTLQPLHPTGQASPTPSLKKTKNRRSLSLNLGPLTPKVHAPQPQSASIGSLTELKTITKSLPERPISPSNSRETPTLTREAANGIISPSSTGLQSTGNNIRGRLAAWTATAGSAHGQGPVAPAPTKAGRGLAPSSYHRHTPSPPQPHQSTGLRQTAISITGGLAPAAGLAKRAVEKMGRAWGGFSSSSSNSGHSTSSSSIGYSDNLGRTIPNTGGSIPSFTSSKKSRRTPDAPSGAWSVSSSSVSDTEAFSGPVGPSLGKRIRAKGSTGIVFGRELTAVVRQTGVGVGVPGYHKHGVVEKLTGVDETIKAILVALESRLLPALVVRCAQHLLLWGVHEEGLFRVNGRPSHVSKLRQEFDAGADFDMTDCSPGELDPHAVASVFKAFLRELPEPILTHSLSPYFEAALSQESAVNAEQQSNAPPPKVGSRGPTLPSGPKSGVNNLRKPPSLSTLAMPNFTGMKPPSRNLCRALKSLLDRLPPENKDLIRTVTELIKATAKEHRDTKMPLSNLLLVFCPSLNMNPPLLRVLCEAEEIWEAAPIDSPVLDIKRESIVLDIKPIPSDRRSTLPEIPKDDTDDDDTFSDAHDGTEEDVSLSTIETSSVDNHSESSHSMTGHLHRTQSKRIAPTGRPMGPRRANLPKEPTMITLPNSPATASTESVSTYESRGNVPSPPPLTSSAESLPTASSSSAAPSFTEVAPEPEPFAKPILTGSIEIADDIESDLLSPSRYRAENLGGTVEFPTTGSTPTTPVSASGRRLKPRLSLSRNSPHSSDSSAQSLPSSPSRRLKRPSLHLLFSKRSTSSLHGSAAGNGIPFISSPQPSPMITRAASESLASTPLTAMTAFELPHTLETDIGHSPFSSGFEIEPRENLSAPGRPTSSASLNDDDDDDDDEEEEEREPIPRISAPTPPPGQTPIANLYSASASTLSLSLSSSTAEKSSPVSAVPSHLRPKVARQYPKMNVSSNHLGLLDDEDQEDWTQSVLIAAGAEGGWMGSRR